MRYELNIKRNRMRIQQQEWMNMEKEGDESRNTILKEKKKSKVPLELFLI